MTLLLEDGDELELEDGDTLLLEQEELTGWQSDVYSWDSTSLSWQGEAVGIFATGKASAASGVSAVLTGGSLSETLWFIRDPVTDEIFRFEINPSQANDRNLSKNIVYSLNDHNNRSLIHQHTPELTEVTVQGTLLSQEQFNSLYEWSRRRHELVLTDDLNEEYTIYITLFDPRREHSPTNDWQVAYNLRYTVV